MRTSNIWKALPTSPDNIPLLFKLYVVTSYMDIYKFAIKLETFSVAGLKAKKNWCITQQHRLRCLVSLDVHGKPQKFRFLVCYVKHPKLRCTTPVTYLNYFSLACWLESSGREGKMPWSKTDACFHWPGGKDNEKAKHSYVLHHGDLEAKRCSIVSFTFQVSWPFFLQRLLKLG